MGVYILFITAPPNQEGLTAEMRIFIALTKKKERKMYTFFYN